MQNYEQDLLFMPKTVKNWKNYLNEEPCLSLFVAVVQSFLEEFGSVETRPNIQFLFEELIHWLKFSIKNRVKELDFLLKAFQFCIKKEVYSIEKFEIALQVLSKTLLTPDIATTLTSSQNLSIFKSLLKTLKSRKLSSFFQKSEEIIENSIISITSLALFHAKDSTNYELIRIIEKILRNESFLFKMGQKASLGILQFLNKYIFDRIGKRFDEDLRSGLEKSDFFNGFNDQDLFFVCEILKFFLSEHCELYEIGLRPIYDQLIGFKNHQINEKIMKSLLRGLKIGKGKNSVEIKKTLISIAVNEDFNSNLYKKIIEKSKKMNWFQENLSGKVKNDIKLIILQCFKLQSKHELLEAIVPWLSQDINIEEYKLMLKQSNFNKSLFPVFLKCMIESVKNSKILHSYNQILPGSGIGITFVNTSFAKFQQFSICLKFYQGSAQEDSCFILIFDKSLAIAINFGKNRLRITITGPRMSSTLVNTSHPLELKTWNFLGICFPISRSQMITNINSKSLEFSDKAFTSFRELSCIKIEGKLRLGYLKLFSSIVTEPNSENEGKNLIFNFTPNKPLFSLNDFEFSSSSKLKTKKKSSEVICESQLFNYFLPLLKKTPDVQNFVLFFGLLSELSSLPSFSSVFSDQFIFLLREILIEKIKNPNMELLDACENLLISLKKTQDYSKVVNSLYLSSQIWTGLDDESFQFYLEAVKSHLIGKTFNRSDAKISEFFVNLAMSSRESMKIVVFYYFFLTFSAILKESEGDKVKVLIEVLEAAEEIKDFDVVEMFSGFLDIVGNEDWKTMNKKEFFELIGTFSGSQFKGKVKTKLLWTSLKLVKVFFFNHFSLSSEKKQLSFMSKLKSILQRSVSPLIYPEQIEILLSFYLDCQVKSSNLIGLTSMLSTSLISTFSTDPTVFEKNLEYLISKVSKNPNLEKFDKPTSTSIFRPFKALCEVLIFQSDFPCWLFTLYHHRYKSQNLPALLLVLFSELSLFKNFNLQRILLFELVSLNHLVEIFEFLSSYLKIISHQVQFEHCSKKYLLEFFNLAEDLVMRIDYNLIPFQPFVEFAELCVIHSAFFQFSLTFSELIGFSCYSVFAKEKLKEFEEVIYLRDGGIIRQLVLIAVVGLSISTSSTLESFLIRVVEKGQRLNGQKAAVNGKQVKEERLEWVGLLQDASVKRWRVSDSSLNGTFSNLMPLYIFHEWAFVIRKYQESGVSSEEILKSVANLMFFVKESNLESLFFIESQSLKSLKNFKSFEKTRNNHLNQMSPKFLPSASTDFEIFLRKKYESDSFLYTDSKGSTKQEEFLAKLKKFRISLENCKKTKDFLVLLQEYWKNIEVQSFFIVLTSLKLTLLSSFYFTKAPICPHYSTRDLRFSNESILENRKKLLSTENLKEYNFLNEFWKIENDFLKFCGFSHVGADKSLELTDSSLFITANQTFTEITLDLTFDQDKNDYFSIDQESQAKDSQDEFSEDDLKRMMNQLTPNT